MKAVGIGFWIAAAILLVIGLAVDTSVESGGYLDSSEIINIGLLQNQLMWWQAGLAALICGSVLFAVGGLIEKLEAAEILIPETRPDTPVTDPGGAIATPVAPAYPCDWCDKSISRPARPCSDLAPEELRAQAGSIRSADCLAVLESRDILPSDGPG